MSHDDFADLRTGRGGLIPGQGHKTRRLPITVRNWTPAERARLFGVDGLIDEGRRHRGYERTTVRVPATPTYLGGIVSKLNEEGGR